MKLPRYPIGNQTALYAPHWLEPYHFAQRHGFGLFEWFSDRRGAQGWDFSQCNTECRKALAREAHAAGMLFTVHSPWDSQPATTEGTARIRSSIEFAADIDARLVVVHLPGSRDETDWIDGMKEPLHWARETGLLLALENTAATSPDDCERIFGAVRRQHGPDAPIGLCFDMGHANLCAATKNDYVGFLKALVPEVNVIHAHVHENWGEADQHLVVFTGPAAHDERGISAMLERLLTRGYQGGFVLEQWPSPPELLLPAVERLHTLLARA